MTDLRALWFSLLFLLVGVALAAFGVPVAPWLAFGLSAWVAAWLPVTVKNEQKIDHLNAQARFCTAFNNAEPETRAALGLKYPTLRIGMNGTAKVFVSDSGVELRYFRRLMLDSDMTFISAASHWGDKTTMRKQWQAWKLYLLQQGDILQDRSKVTESWRWKSAEAYWRNYAYVSMQIPVDLIPAGVEVPEGVMPLPPVPAEADILAQFD